MRHTRQRQTSALLTLILAGCAPYTEGLLATPAGSGPEVTVDWDAEPLPEIPFPNDLATRVDPGSPTGLRLNISMVATTHAESEARTKLNELSGFGVYAPITVGFEAPLDLDNIYARHTGDTKLGAEQFADDAFFVINIDPDSPEYLQAVELDVGHGRYPLTAASTTRYFENDPYDDAPTIVFNTADEDTNGNGVLDWGEDLDNDGVLDVPNVYPEGGDPVADLLTWYERETDTLIFRPIEPLLEETRYAVVLTSRLVGEDGEPVRSPWPWVNHTRQTEVLAPVLDALPALGVETSEVAFAWSFTTGRVTGDLVDVYRGLHGEGPFGGLSAEYPAGVREALKVAEGDEPQQLPAETLISALVDLGLFDGEGADVLRDNYNTFSRVLVGGSFQTPNFLADRDDGGLDTSDEWWQVDPVAGTWSAAPERVPFTCILPEGEHDGPWPVAIYGHGYGSSRFEALTFMWAFSRMGIAACFMDYPGHGPGIAPEERDLYAAILGTKGLLPFLEHLEDARFRDLNNDGYGDSGGDQWTADAFHTRDMVRQAVVDTMQLVASLQACGQGTMTLPDGGTAVACDWDGDGAPDLGGPDVPYYGVGGSLGGINMAVAAAVIPDVTAWVPHVPGAGLLDVGFRTKIGGAVEAMHGRLWGVLILGAPQKDGSLQLYQRANSVTDMAYAPIATLPSIPAGGRIVVENLSNGELSEGYIPDDGRLRLPIAADALSAPEKRALLGMTDEALQNGTTYTVSDNTLLGDPLVISVYDASEELVAEITAFEEGFVHEGVSYAAGSTLVPINEGLGHTKGSPRARRIGMVFSAILEPGDPVAYAPYYTKRPLEILGGEPRNVIVSPTIGDPIVNISTGIALARAAGWLERAEIDDRYGMPVDQWLVDRGVVEGLAHYGPYTCAGGAPCLFDPDDLDNGTDDYQAPSDAPLRLTLDTASGQSGLRLPYVNPTGTHGISMPDPGAGFDISTFTILQIASYFASGGTQISDDPCLADGSCDWIPALPTDNSKDKN